ncbi:concanavalin A-like lectin/glucanase domain-containing protein [Tanacetum coccineum]
MHNKEGSAGSALAMVTQGYALVSHGDDRNPYVYVGNLDPVITEDELRQLFKCFGKGISVCVVYSQETAQAYLGKMPAGLDVKGTFNELIIPNSVFEDIVEIIRAFAINNEATKKRKREDNLWKWSDVIAVDDLPDEFEPANVPKTKETTTKEQVMVSENNNSILTYLSVKQHEINDDDILMAPIKRNKQTKSKTMEEQVVLPF